MLECEFHKHCLNNNKCYRCSEHKLLKQKNKTNSGLFNITNQKELNKKDSWKNLESEVAKRLNQLPTIQEARRTLASGALPFEKGDVLDSKLFVECKERKGNQLKSGEKSISIKKEWLEKAKKECQYSNKTMCLPFRFKEDENIYCIINMDDLIALVNTIKVLESER